jgi:3-oxocholest-4-en-26-oate---CoA ligase
VALNIADLAEHAIDAVPDRVVLIAGDEQLTYAQLEEKANRLAHYLIDQGVKKDDKVGLYCRNRIEIVIAMLGIVKAGAILVNVNFRYVEGELKYLFENSDMVALVHERRYADRVAKVLPETPNVKTILVVNDGSAGSDEIYQRYDGVEFYSALDQGSPDRDFGERQCRRYLPALHRRHHRFPEGRDVAPRGHLPGAVRRHRLHDGRRTQG